MREKLIELLMDKPFGNSTEEREIAHAEDLADYMIANGVTVQKWIPVTERLPEVNSEVLVCDTRESYVSSWAYRGNGYWFNDERFWKTDDITHWMPLPEPPKGE